MKTSYQGFLLGAFFLLSSTPLRADGGVVVNNGTTSFSVAEGERITFSPSGLKVASQNAPFSFSTLGRLTLGIDRSAVVPAGGAGSSVGETAIAVVMPPATYPEPFYSGDAITDLSGGSLIVSGSYTYTGLNITPQFSVVYESKTLTAGTDYTVSLTNNRNAGTAMLTVKGIGRYTGTMSKYFVINPAALTIKADAQTKSYGDAVPELTYSITGFVKGENEAMLTTPVSISTTATAASAVGDYDITVSGASSSNYSIAYEQAKLTVQPKNLSTATVTLADHYEYTGQPVVPDCKVSFDGTELRRDVDYILQCSNNSAVGTANVTVQGKGNYIGKIDTTFTIKEIFKLAVTIDGKLFSEPTMVLSYRANYMASHGRVQVDDYDGNVGDTLKVSVIPISDYLVGDCQMPETIQSDTLDDNSVNFYFVKPRADIAIVVNFVKNGTVGVQEQRQAEMLFSMADRETVRIVGAAPQAPVCVYDARGQQVAVIVRRTGNDMFVSLAGKPQGLYIIQVNNHTFKTYKR